MPLKEKQLNRYARQIMLKEIGTQGQEKLLLSKVLIIGAGGLGSAALYYLSASGVGNIGIVDFDRVEDSNLQRQIIHSSYDIGKLKVDSARESIQALNNDVLVKTYNEKLVLNNAEKILSKYHFVIDACDNFTTRFLISDTCHKLKIPYSYGGVEGFSGQTLTVLPGESACLRCLFHDEPDTNKLKETPVFPPIIGTIGSIQAYQALKYFLNIGNLLTNQLLIFEGLDNKFRTVELSQQENCLLRSNSDDIP